MNGHQLVNHLLEGWTDGEKLADPRSKSDPSYWQKVNAWAASHKIVCTCGSPPMTMDQMFGLMAGDSREPKLDDEFVDVMTPENHDMFIDNAMSPKEQGGGGLSRAQAEQYWNNVLKLSKDPDFSVGRRRVRKPKPTYDTSFLTGHSKVGDPTDGSRVHEPTCGISRSAKAMFER